RIAIVLSMTISGASAESFIVSGRLKEVHPGMSKEEVEAVLGPPDVTVVGYSPGDTSFYDFVFIDFESQGLLTESGGLAGFGADHKLLAFGLTPQKIDPPATRSIPFGRSNSREPFAKLSGTSIDSRWGYSRENPIKVGGLHPAGPSASEKAFLNALRGP